MQSGAGKQGMGRPEGRGAERLAVERGRKLTAHLWELPQGGRDASTRLGAMGDRDRGGKDAATGSAGLSQDREAGSTRA